MDTHKGDLKVIDVLPISRGIFKNSLSYFTSSSIEMGNIVSVEVRNKKILALVSGIEDVKAKKSELKSSSFSLKKIDSIQGKKFLKEEYIRAAQKTGEYFATNTGRVLHSVIPKAILDLSGKIKVTDEPKPHAVPEKFVIQADEEERYSNYRSLIREEFARKCSVILILPTIEDVKHAERKLTKGIEKYTYVIHSSLTTKTQAEIIKKILKEEHPILIISTPSFLAIPRQDIATIIVDRENSRSYKRDFRPFIDFRKFAEFYAEINKTRIIFGDSLLRIETIWRQKNDELFEFGRMKFRSLGTSNTKIIDMTLYKGPNSTEFRIFSEEVEEVISGIKNSNENLFLYAGRKGLYPTTICGDCGDAVTCTNCKIPIILYPSKTEESGNYFLCNRCGERRSAHEKCARCNSWKLVTLGIGIDLIEKQVREIAPDVEIFKLDSDSVRPGKQAEKLVEKFYNSPGSIIIGTEMALFYLNEEIVNSAIVSFDSLFSIPDFRINEKIMQIVLKIRSFTQKNFIIQSRNAERNVLRFAATGNLIDFYKEEVEERKRFEYPPFSHFIKISFSGRKPETEKAMQYLKDQFSEFEIHVFSALSKKEKGLPTIHGLVKISRESWPKKELLSKLLALPPEFEVRINPDNLL